MQEHIKTYAQKLTFALSMSAMDKVVELGQALREAWKHGKNVYLCGNGGSAGNANHLANDFFHGAGSALPQNPEDRQFPFGRFREFTHAGTIILRLGS